MNSLSKRRPIFHSEADFQHEFAWEIRKAKPETQIRLEFPLELQKQKTAHLDIWLPVKQVAIELKYYTRELDLDWQGESYQLRNHGAHPPKRYDFLNDIQRLERLKSKIGIAILLTNDPLYWRPPPRSGIIDAAFRIHELQEITGIMEWRGSPATGTIKSRESPITLRGSYQVGWRDYCAIPSERFGKFQYLAVTVES